jgi:hypothetical protein
LSRPQGRASRRGGPIHDEANAHDAAFRGLFWEAAAACYGLLLHVSRLHPLSLSPVTLDQVLADVDLVARNAGVADRSTKLVRGLSERLEAVRRRTAGLPPPRVICMEWLDPPYSAGHWVPEMVELAGGCDALGTRPAHRGVSPGRTWSSMHPT